MPDRQREQAERAEPEVRHRRVRDQLLDVVLRERDDRAVDDADHRQDGDVRRQHRRAVREQRHRQRMKP
jgi:hypothetical protein